MYVHTSVLSVRMFIQLSGICVHHSYGAACTIMDCCVVRCTVYTYSRWCTELTGGTGAPAYLTFPAHSTVVSGRYSYVRPLAGLCYIFDNRHVICALLL